VQVGSLNEIISELEYERAVIRGMRKYTEDIEPLLDKIDSCYVRGDRVLNFPENSIYQYSNKDKESLSRTLMANLLTGVRGLANIEKIKGKTYSEIREYLLCKSKESLRKVTNLLVMDGEELKKLEENLKKYREELKEYYKIIGGDTSEPPSGPSSL
jgi:hypothetical protein